ncbi:GYDIA family GHMP kinase [Labilibacter marinus]|uniref:GYDIA family GHMP kinase n=1 Tax=Labilibacter marinus TaxID=1477105 RepID=UPI00094FDA2D|nr:GYDIA family GHMP kinase [Labilibacter marinus]
MQKQEQVPVFSSRGNGKLMISGEYLVLKGAKALSVPLKIGQSFEVFESNNNHLTWEATHIEGNWNSVIFNDRLTITSCSDEGFAKQLQKIVRAGIKHSKLNIKDLMGKKIITHLEFLPEWGLGSSSTLVYNLARYLEIDPYQLLQETFKGSGYDIANASHQMPIFFLLINDKPRSVEINFDPKFKENIYFIYRGNKQSSKSAIRGFHKKKVDKEDINRISAISTYLTVCNDIAEFQELINEHEDIVGRVIGKKTVKQEHFSDFDGSIKSLGAWGGDFVMAVTSQPKEYVLNYFHGKDLKVIFDYDNLVLNNPCMEC